MTFLFYSDSFTGHVEEIEENKEIGTIDIWGPMFRVSFDLIIHSYVRGKGRKGWTTVFSFKGNGGKRHCCKHGDRTSWSFCNDMVVYLCFVSLANNIKK